MLSATTQTAPKLDKKPRPSEIISVCQSSPDFVNSTSASAEKVVQTNATEVLTALPNLRSLMRILRNTRNATAKQRELKQRNTVPRIACIAKPFKERSDNRMVSTYREDQRSKSLSRPTKTSRPEHQIDGVWWSFSCLPDPFRPRTPEYQLVHRPRQSVSRSAH